MRLGSLYGPACFYANTQHKPMISNMLLRHREKSGGGGGLGTSMQLVPRFAHLKRGPTASLEHILDTI